MLMISEEADRRNARSAYPIKGQVQNNMEDKTFLYVKSLFYK